MFWLQTSSRNHNTVLPVVRRMKALLIIKPVSTPSQPGFGTLPRPASTAGDHGPHEAPWFHPLTDHHPKFPFGGPPVGPWQTQEQLGVGSSGAAPAGTPQASVPAVIWAGMSAPLFFQTWGTEALPIKLSNRGFLRIARDPGTKRCLF